MIVPRLICCCLVIVSFNSCDGIVDSSDSVSTTEIIRVDVKKTGIYEYNTGVCGDEESVMIIRQANHFATSRIIRNDSTNFVAVYLYEPQAGFTGIDYVELEKRLGSDGASPPNTFEKVEIVFMVSN